MKKQAPRIALIVAHPMRDLPGLVLTAVALCQQGFICHLVPGSVRKREIWGLVPDLVLLFNVQTTQAGFISQLKTAQIPYGLLDTEGGVWRDPKDYLELLHPDRAVTRAVRPVCAWSPVLSDCVVDHGAFSRDQIELTGCPRFDFYTAKWRPVLSQPENSDGRARVLVNTAFSEYNAGLSTPEEMYNELASIPGWTDERIRAYMKTQQEGLETMMQLVRQLAAEYPHVDFVLRPHPAESSDPYSSGLAGIPNVSINRTGPVQTQLFTATAVIQRSCTTAIESNLAGVPTFSPQFVPAVPIVQTAESVSVPCHDYEELKDHLDSVFEGTWQTPEAIESEMHSVVAKWFYRVDGESYHRVAKAIENALPARAVDEGLCRRWFHGLHGKQPSHLSKAVKSMRHRLRLSPDWMSRRAAPDPMADREFNVEVVHALSERITNILRAEHSGVRPINVQLASDRGDFLDSYQGLTVTLAAA